MSSRESFLQRLHTQRSSTTALAVLFEYYEDCLREDATRCSRSRRPSLPILQQQPILNKPMSSVGHAKARRPSLVEFHDAMRYHAVDIDGPPYLIAHFPDFGDTSEKIPVESGLKLYQVFEEPLRARGMNVNDVEIFIERSSSAIPENADVRFLAGRNVIVRGKAFAVIFPIFPYCNCFLSGVC
ncbi:hypothetical protein GCK32_017712 [Trichostrongylus colubriformis]|uniref:Uncharacterized protein n=1 Tax=Trichostrongylus colubriformis TaxID=6319 RepID=A0AAN8ENB0_TRICO